MGTTHAKRLEARGCVRLSIDELVFTRHGSYGVDYREHLRAALERDAIEQLLSDIEVGEERPAKRHSAW